MSRNPEYQFVDTTTSKLQAQLEAAYEEIVGLSIQPASPEKLFLSWITSIILQERVLANWAANQNIPSRAEGENLDALAELFYVQERPEAQSATCTERFTISQAQTRAILVPQGTRCTDASALLVWETVEDIYIPIGSTYADVQIKCQTPGVTGNGYEVGQINTIVDVFDYYQECSNITASDNGADRATDDEFYEIMSASMDGFSCAGARGSYVYFAKQVSTEIADVVANSPEPGKVSLYTLMSDGTIASEETKAAVLAACSAEDVRPLADDVEVGDPETVSYDIELTYYTATGATKTATEIQEAVDAAVQEYVTWQSGKLGRDINPSYLIGLLMQTGIKRVDLTSPAFTSLRDGSDGTVPQIAAIGTTSVVNGGLEDD